MSIQSELKIAILVNDVEKVDFLLNKGQNKEYPDLNSIEFQNNPILDTAVKEGNLVIIKKLLDYQGNSDSSRAIDPKTTLATPFIWAVLKDMKEDVLQLLISKGLDVNNTDSAGFTALHYAVEKKQYKNVKLLLESGANPNAIQDKLCEHGYINATPLHIAALVEDLEMVTILSKHEAQDKQSFMWPNENNNNPKAETALTIYATGNKQRESAFKEAVQKGKEKLRSRKRFFGENFSYTSDIESLYKRKEIMGKG